MKESEQDLLKKVKNSDKDAFHQLFSNFFDTLFRFVVYKVNESDLAEDISQETFLRVWNYDLTANWVFSSGANYTNIDNMYVEAGTGFTINSTGEINKE